jgi:two-component system sensor histidine kinase TctE
VSGDPILLRELVKNLVDNAIRYCPKGSTITVRVVSDHSARSARLTVEDDGPGIPVNERARVLERFHRGAEVQQQGSGLGLAIVKEVAERHGGVVELQSSDAGGLAVHVRLPLANDAAHRQ